MKITPNTKIKELLESGYRIEQHNITLYVDNTDINYPFRVSVDNIHIKNKFHSGIYSNLKLALEGFEDRILLARKYA